MSALDLPDPVADRPALPLFPVILAGVALIYTALVATQQAKAEKPSMSALKLRSSRK